MSYALVTLAKAKRHLKITVSDFDDDVADLIADASDLVMDHMKFNSLPDLWNEATGSPSGEGVPESVQRGTLLVIGELDRNKNASMAEIFSPAVKMALQKYRDPTLA